MDEQLLRYFSGELSEDELSGLLDRIENNDRLKTEFVRLQNLTAVSELLPHSSDKEEARKNYKIFEQQVQRHTRRVLTINIFKYVAMAVILVTSTVWGTLKLLDREMDSTANTLYVPSGQRAQITLQDGTEVWLNAQSTLKYPSRFSKKSREVEITGEAFFDVAEEKKRPFIVSTQHIDMEVLGTQFNVYSYPEAGYIKTTLVEGLLRVSERGNASNTALLNPNEQLTFKDNKMDISAITNQEHLLWREGIYAFDNERLIDIIEKLQLYYDVKIAVEDPEIFDVRYTGKFRQRDGIDEILRLLQKIQSFKITYNRDENIITLTK